MNRGEAQATSKSNTVCVTQKQVAGTENADMSIPQMHKLSS